MQKDSEARAEREGETQTDRKGRGRTVDVEDVVVEGLAHRVGGHAAVRPVVGLVQVLDVQVGAGDDGVRRHSVVHLDPGHLLRPGVRGEESANIIIIVIIITIICISDSVSLQIVYFQFKVSAC